MPEKYEGGSSDELEELAEKIGSLGSDYEQMASAFEQNPEMLVFWCYDPDLSSRGFMTNVLVIAEPIPESITLKSYFNAATGILPEQIRVVEKGIVELDEYEAGRFVLETTVEGLTVKQLAYITKAEKTMYSITYSTSASEFNERLPTFEESINTFRY